MNKCLLDTFYNYINLKEITFGLYVNRAHGLSAIVPCIARVFTLVIRPNVIDTEGDVAIGLVVSHRVLTGSSCGQNQVF